MEAATCPVQRPVWSLCDHVPTHFTFLWCEVLGAHAQLWDFGHLLWGTSTKTRTHLEVQTEMYPKKTFQPAGKFSPSYP